jgi:hypothetical protein
MALPIVKNSNNEIPNQIVEVLELYPYRPNDPNLPTNYKINNMMFLVNSIEDTGFDMSSNAINPQRLSGKGPDTVAALGKATKQILVDPTPAMSSFNDLLGGIGSKDFNSANGRTINDFMENTGSAVKMKTRKSRLQCSLIAHCLHFAAYWPMLPFHVSI